MTKSKIAAIVSLAVLLFAGVFAVNYGYREVPITYDGSNVNVLELYENPENYDVSNADGAAAVIVQENLAKTRAANNVAAIVFDFRGYDTLGESFILLTAIAGSYVILSSSHKKKKEGGAES